jgi:signal transduction histidine kinase/Tfp pilus assembly protein PilF
MRKTALFLLLILCFGTKAQDISFHKKYDSFIVQNKKDFLAIDSFFEADKYDTLRLHYAFEKSKRANAYTIQAYIANKIGTFYRNNSNYKKALLYHNYGLKLSRKIKNISLEIISFNMLGVVYRRMDSINPAIENHQNALRIIENTKIFSEDILKSKSVSLNSLGNIYLTLNQYDLALANFYKTLFIEKKLKNNKGISINYQNIGGVYENQNKLDFALDNYKKSLQYNHDAIGVLICNNNIGVILLKKKEPKKALDYILPTIAIANKVQDDFYTANAHIDLGWAYLELNQLEKAKSNLDIGLKIASKKNYPSYEATAYKLLSEIAEKQKDFSVSNLYLKKHFQITEKISGAKNQKSLFDYIMKYENEKKETILKLKNKEIEINKLSLANKEKQKYYLIAGLLLLAIIGSLLFYQSQNRNRINQKLQLLNTELDQANKTKTRFFSILNHDLRSPVANLIHFLHLQKESPELLDTESKIRLQDKTLAGAENLLTSMEDILLWSKGQMENFWPQPKNVFVTSLFEDTKKHFESQEKVQIVFQNPENIQLNTDENYLKTIIRNLTGNAIKALADAQNPTIIWKAWQENNKVLLSITDNGKGASQENFKALYDDTQVVGIKTGLGLHLIRDLATAINCKIVVDSKIGTGTTFTLQL